MFDMHIYRSDMHIFRSEIPHKVSFSSRRTGLWAKALKASKFEFNVCKKPVEIEVSNESFSTPAFIEHTEIHNFISASNSTTCHFSKSSRIPSFWLIRSDPDYM